MQIQHLLQIETTEQYNTRILREMAKFSVLPAVHATHVHASASDSMEPTAEHTDGA